MDLLIFDLPGTSASARRRLAAALRTLVGPLTGFIVSLTLAACNAGGGVGALMVDPGRYTLYHCDDLATRWKALSTREAELRGLMEKASDGGGGALIGTVAYRADYESVLAEKQVLQRTAADKKCDLKTDYQSDQTIR